MSENGSMSAPVHAVVMRRFHGEVLRRIASMDERIKDCDHPRLVLDRKCWESRQAGFKEAVAVMEQILETTDERGICEVLGFDPINHHNAAKCPYCQG